MRTVFFLILILFIKSTVYSQSVQRVLNKGYAKNIKQCSEGGFILTGGLATFTNDKNFLMKFDSVGNLKWLKTYYDQVELFSYGSEVLDLQGKGFVTVGYMFHDTISNEEITFMKTDSTGNLIWSKMIGNPMKDDEAKSVVSTSSGYLLAGFTSGYGGGGEDFLLLKTDTSGNLINSKVYGSSFNDRGVKIIQHQNGFIFGGYGELNANGDQDLCFLFLDNSENIISEEHLAMPGNQKLYDLMENSDGSLIVAATTDTGQNTPQSLIIKLSSTGAVLWDKVLQGNYSIPYSAKQSLNGFTITGASMTHPFEENAFVIELDDSGNRLSENYFGDSSGCVMNAFVSVDDHVIAAGYYTLPAVTRSSIYLNKYYYNDTACNHFSVNSSFTSPAISVSALTWQTYTPTVPSMNSLIVYQSVVSHDSLLCNPAINVEEILLNKQFAIFPNPASENISIILPEEQIGTMINIYNSCGSLIKNILTDKKINVVPAVNLPAGIYTVQVINKNSLIAERLIIYR